MWKIAGAIALAAGAMLFNLGDAAAQAEGPFPPAVIATVDTSRVLAQSEAGKDLQRRASEIRGQLQTEYGPRKEALDSEQAELQQQQNVLSPDAFQVRAESFVQRATEFQEEVGLREAQLRIAVQNATQELLGNLSPILSTLMEQHQVTILLPRDQVLSDKAGVDLTQAALQLLNERTKSVKFELPPLAEIQKQLDEARAQQQLQQQQPQQLEGLEVPAITP